MPKISKETAEAQISGPVEDHSGELDGYTVNLLSFNDDIDGTPLMKGLPDDRCQCPHWGYVLKGRLTFRFADREEVFEEGDAFYLPPGHVPLATAGTEYVQFSPTDEMKATDEAIERNMRAMEAG